MKEISYCATALAAIMATGFIPNASAASLNVGDPAPKLQTGAFVQGEQVKEFAPGKAYIVELWATWCGPCKVSIPHLNEIHNRYKDRGLIVIGQDCWEKDESKVAPFIKTMGEKMIYRVALDDKNGSTQGKMSDTWMTAADRKGIPSAFVVDTRGNIAWIGHPMELKDKVIEGVLAGTFNGREYVAAEEAAQKQIGSLKKDIEAGVKAKEWDKASDSLDKLAVLAEGDGNLSDYVALKKFNVFVGKKEFPAAFDVARKLGEAKKDNAMYQNMISLLLTTDAAIEHPDLKLALELSQRAVRIADDPASKGLYLDTLARVQFMKGNKEEAIGIEQQAVESAAKNASIAATLQKGLDFYKRGELPPPTWERMKPAAKKTA